MRHRIKNIFLLISIFLFGCSKSYNVGLYKDEINKDSILAIFPSESLEVAMSNCESTVQLYNVDDSKNGYVSCIS